MNLIKMVEYENLSYEELSKLYLTKIEIVNNLVKENGIEGQLPDHIPKLRDDLIDKLCTIDISINMGNIIKNMQNAVNEVLEVRRNLG